MAGDSDQPGDNLSTLPAILQSTAAAVPQRWRHRAAAAAFRVIAGASYEKIQQASHGFDMLKGQSLVTGRLAMAAAESAASNPDIVDRALRHFLAKEFRVQENREEVARMALEHLGDTTGSAEVDPDDPPQIDDDWFTKFDRVVADVSSDQMKQLLSRILAGEIRKPGAFSLRTLRFVSELDQETASIFQRVCQSHLSGNSIVADPAEWRTGDNYRSIVRLLDQGLVVEKAGASNRPPQRIQETGIQIIWGENARLVMKSTKKMELPIIQLSQIGREMLPLLGPYDEIPTLTKAYEILSRTGGIEHAFIVAGAPKTAHLPMPILKVLKAPGPSTATE